MHETTETLLYGPSAPASGTAAPPPTPMEALGTGTLETVANPVGEPVRNLAPASGYAKRTELRSILSTEAALAPAVGSGPEGLYRIDPPTPEVIIGTDDRVRITDTAAWPYSVHGHLVITFPTGLKFIGSGTLVGDRHVLTAGHCVYSAANGGYAKEILFSAAQNDDQLPFPPTRAVHVLSVKDWEQSQDSNWDMGMLILEDDVGAAGKAGHYRIKVFASDPQLSMLRVNITGYPGDKGGRQMWTQQDIIKSVAPERFYYDIDTMGGQSGSGVWSVLPGVGETVVGIHTTGAQSGNGATRITQQKCDIIQGWIGKF